MWARFARLLGIAGLSVPVVLLAFLPAARASATSEIAAAGSGEQITSYRISVTIQPDGVTHVREVIAYDFGTSQRHGIYRDILDRLPANGGHVQEFPIRNITVSSPDGAPSQTAVTQNDHELMIRIGDPDQTITGRHRYVLSYDIARALAPVADTQMLDWNLIGTDWTVPIRHVIATVSGPGTLSGVVCYAGPEGSHARCDSTTVTGNRARFSQGALPPGQGIEIAVLVPPGSVQAAPPLLANGSGSPGTLEPTLHSAILAVVAVVLLWTWPWLMMLARRLRAAKAELPAGLVRHARHGGGHPGHTGVAPEETGRVIRPAEADVVRSGQIMPRHIAATVVDLAIRGYLRIEDLPGTAHGGRGSGGRPAEHDAADHEARDWRLIRQSPLPSASAGLAGSRAGLLLYEYMLLGALFRDGDRVRVSQLKESFRAPLGRICAQLARDVQVQGWLKVKGCEARGWLHVARAAVLIGVIVLVIGLQSAPDLAGAPFFGIVVGAAGLLAILVTPRLRRAPYRYTARGRRLVEDLKPVRRQLAEDPLPSAVSPWTQFSSLLPYATALGLAERWTRRFAEVPVPAQISGWLPARLGGSLVPDWYFTSFTDHICQLAPYGYLSVAVAGSTAAAAISGESHYPYLPTGGWLFGSSGLLGGGGSGGVGGGGGGGGGGSW
jgi:predicted membrane protein DUF2207